MLSNLNTSYLRGLLLATSLFLVPAVVHPQPAQQRADATSIAESAVTAAAPLEIADYARWRSISAPTLSADGGWVAWAYTGVRRDDVLHVRHVESGREHVVERGSRAVFSDDGRWVAYNVAPPLAEIDKLEADDKPVPRRAELMELATGTKVGWDDVASFEFAEAGTHIVIRKNQPTLTPKPKHAGADMIIRDLRAGSDELVGSVAWHGFNDGGTQLAWVVDADDMDGNGVYLLDLATGARRVLDSSRSKYARATWSEDGASFGVLRGVDADTLEQRENMLIAFTNMRAAQPTRVEVAAGSSALPAGHVASDKAALDWNAKGDRLFFGVKAQQRKPPKDEDRPAWQKASDVDVFHWNDDRIQTLQARQAQADRNRTERAVLHLSDRRIVVLQDSTTRGITVGRDGRWAVVWDDREYVSDWEESRADYYRVDVNTGTRTPILDAHMSTLGMTPDGDRYLYWQDNHVWAYDLARDRHTNLTANAPVSFTNAEWDYLSTPPPYGVAGYTQDGRGVVLNHRYDLWYVPFDGGTARNLTGGLGAEREMRLRYVRLDPDARFIDLSQPVLLSAYGQWTKQAGFYELNGGRMRELVYSDNIYNNPQKARHADRMLFTRQSWTEYPDLHITSTRFADVRRITTANPQQAEYAWGRRILFDYTNSDGVKLQGTLAIPDSWQQGQRLPMLVQFYEKYSQNLHLYPTPVYRHSPQFAAYVSKGYLVMQPDVHFRGGSSHSDMLECIEAAVAKVIELGYADPERVGLHGHSYSGGGASYIATRSNAFAAIVAGAAPINLVGEFNILFRGSGQNNHRYDIYGQGRYGSNPYDDFDMYWDQSPISGVTTMDTPLLYMHGDDDQIVEYLQGMEFYNALRFNKKPVIFLSYPGEGHGLTELENQLDFLTRMEQFYGHYLKGEPAASWITNGERFIDKDRRSPVRINVPQSVTDPVAAGGGGDGR